MYIHHLQFEEYDKNMDNGEKSVLMIQFFMHLRTEEAMAIRWHMGFSEEKSLYGTLDKAMEKYPIVLAFHEADLEASKLMEDKDGNKRE